MLSWKKAQLFKLSLKLKYIEIINVFLPTVQCWEGGGRLAVI